MWRWTTFVQRPTLRNSKYNKCIFTFHHMSAFILNFFERFFLLFTFPDNWGIDVVKSRRIFEQNWLGLFEFRIKKLAEKQTSNTESESFTALVSHFQRECLTRWKPNLLVILEKLCDVAIFSISYELESSKSQFLKLCRYIKHGFKKI